MTDVSIPHDVDPTKQLEVYALRSVILGQLVSLGVELGMLTALALAPRQEKNAMISQAALLEQDEMIRGSRKDLKLQRAAGLNPPVISRPPAPVSILDLLTQIHSALSGHETKAWRILGAVPNRSRLLDLTDQQRLAQLEARVTQVWDTKWLLEVDADLARLIEMSKTLLDGEPKTLMNANCPWCGHKTLVIYKTQGLVKCEADETGRRQTCICSAGTDCGCTRGKRHEWKRSDGGFSRLARMLEHPTNKENTK